MNTPQIMLLFLAFANASPFTDSMRQEWKTFKTTYNKEYKDETEENYRMKIFTEKVDYIAQHNAKYARGDVSFEVGVNHLSDMTRQEVADTMKGLKIDAKRDLITESGSRNYYTFDPNVSVPTSFDWREKDCVTPIKDQGRCGSCYAFSATGAMECRHKLKTGDLVSLSEQNLVDCTISFGNYGCRGGEMTNCYNYVKVNEGIDTEEAYLYIDDEGECHYELEGKGATVTAYMEIGIGDELALMQAVANCAVSVGIDANHVSFEVYKSGIYYEPECSTTELDHAVLIVGYGTEDGIDYWIVKNSWKTTWGENGYARMARNRDNHCGIASLASFPLE